MLALGLDAAKNIAIAVVIGFVVLALVAASAIKNVTYKIVVTLVLAGFALGVWTQRSNLEDCADRVRATGGAATTCAFFGGNIEVPGVRSPTPTTVP